MKPIIIFLLMLMMAAACSAQPEPDILWARTFGGPGLDFAASLCATADGGAIIAGSSQMLGFAHPYLVRLSNSGDTLWTRVLNLGNTEEAYALCAATDGGWIFAGSVQFIESGSTAMLMVKVDANGDTVWMRTYAAHSVDLAYAIQPTPDGGYILAGGSQNLEGHEDVFVVRTNAAGDTLWTHIYPATRNDHVLSIDNTADGGFVIAGYNYQPPQGTSGFMMKITTAGDPLWRRDYGGVFNRLSFARQTVDGGYMVAGTGATPPPYHLAPYLMKTDNTGNAVWTQLYSASPLDMWLNTARLTSDGGYVAAGGIGNIDSAVYGMEILRMDSLGFLLWRRMYGADSSSDATCIVETADHGYLAAGAAVIASQGADLFALRTGSEGMVMLYPIGGEALGIGRTADIRWNGSVYGGNVMLELNRSYPSGTWEAIAQSTANTGQYAWTVSGPESEHARIRIRHLTLPTLNDTSDGDFSLRIPSLRLLWPNGGETVLTGMRDSVRFGRTLVTDNLLLELNRDYPSGAWDTLASDLTNDSLAFWIVQLPGGTHCRLRLLSMLNPAYGDTSDADFVLRAPEMTLSAPNGGESLPVGSPFTITWAAPEHQGRIRITLNRNYPSDTWETVAANVVNNGQYVWTPAGTASEHCRIRIATVFDPQTRVESAADFAITSLAAGGQAGGIPTAFALNAPHPNPFNSQTLLSFSLPARGEVSLVLYDLSGRAVRTIVAGMMEGGAYQILFDAAGLPSGTYFSRLQWGEKSQVQKMMLLK